MTDVVSYTYCKIWWSWRKPIFTQESFGMKFFILIYLILLSLFIVLWRTDEYDLCRPPFIGIKFFRLPFKRRPLITIISLERLWTFLKWYTCRHLSYYTFFSMIKEKDTRVVFLSEVIKKIRYSSIHLQKFYFRRWLKI